MKRADLRDSTIVLLAVLQVIVILLTHGNYTLEDCIMLAEEPRTQTLFMYDNDGLLLEMKATQLPDGNSSMSITHTEGIPQHAMASALIDYALCLCDDIKVRDYLYMAKTRILSHEAYRIHLTQNDRLTREDDLPF